MVQVLMVQISEPSYSWLRANAQNLGYVPKNNWGIRALELLIFVNIFNVRAFASDQTVGDAECVSENTSSILRHFKRKGLLS